MRLVIATLLATMLGACGHDRPPKEFRPASRDCVPLVGDFVVDDRDLAWLAPSQALPAGMRFPFLSVQDPGNGTLTMVLRRRTSDVLAEAATLQITDPDKYRAWRAWVLGEPADPELLSIAGASAGPLVSYSWQVGAGECHGGWRGRAMGVAITPRAGSAPEEHLAFISLARSEGGGLLVQRQVRRRTPTGLNLRGQELAWYRYAYSDWHRIPAAPAGSVPGALSASDLPAMPSRSERMALEFARREQWGRFQSWVRDQLPSDTTLTIFRERQMDPVAMALPRDQRRIEIAGHWPPGAPDPITPLLKGRADVSDLVVKQSRLQANNRPYLLIEFTLTAKP